MLRKEENAPSGHKGGRLPPLWVPRRHRLVVVPVVARAEALRLGHQRQRARQRGEPRPLLVRQDAVDEARRPRRPEDAVHA